MRSFQHGFLAVVLAMAAVLVPQVARADVHFYRYSISTYKPGPPKYTGIVASSNVKGAVRRVETDARGRVQRLQYFRDGKKLTETVYQYKNNAQLSSGYRFYRGAELSSIAIFQRDPASGQIARADYKTAKGALTSYTLYTYSPNKIEYEEYTPDGSSTSRGLDYYSDAGIIVRNRSYSYGDTGGDYSEQEYDATTGLSLSEKQFEDGKLVIDKRYTRDATGDMTRIDLVDPSDGSIYGIETWGDGLERARSYHFKDKTTEQVGFSYDAKRMLSKADLQMNGKFVCSFRYERLADGTVKKTIAKGPAGDVWAEYPNRTVSEVHQTGKPIDNGPSTVYKTGNWW
ncbi:MAG: hypothetical protein ACRENA_02635 [Vulcanimicrobiaceae bacterium]